MEEFYFFGVTQHISDRDEYDILFIFNDTQLFIINTGIDLFYDKSWTYGIDIVKRGPSASIEDDIVPFEKQLKPHCVTKMTAEKSRAALDFVLRVTKPNYNEKGYKQYFESESDKLGSEVYQKFRDSKFTFYCLTT